MNTQLTTRDETAAAIALVTNGLTSDYSKRAYSKALTDFFTWREQNGNPALTKATVQEYRQTLTGSPASINLKMSAIQELAYQEPGTKVTDSSPAHRRER